MDHFKLKNEYITLQQFLKNKGIISSGGEAKFFLVENEVYVNQEKENRRGRKLYVNDKLYVNGKEYIME